MCSHCHYVGILIRGHANGCNLYISSWPYFVCRSYGFVYLLLMTVTEIRSCEITPCILRLKAITCTIHHQYTCNQDVYFGKHDTYSILDSLQVRQTMVFLSCCNRRAASCRGTKCSCKERSCQHRCRSIHTSRILILPKLAPKLDTVCLPYTVLSTLAMYSSPHGRSCN